MDSEVAETRRKALRKLAGLLGRPAPASTTLRVTVLMCGATLNLGRIMCPDARPLRGPPG